MNTPTEQPSQYPTIEAWKSIDGGEREAPVNTHPEPLPRCSWCGGVASTDPCVSCRPKDVADTERGQTLFWTALMGLGLIVGLIAGGLGRCFFVGAR